jgi:hypothetical protein
MVVLFSSNTMRLTNLLDYLKKLISSLLGEPVPQVAVAPIPVVNEPRK